MIAENPPNKNQDKREEIALSLLQEEINSGRVFNFEVISNSMSPLLKEGDRVLIKPAKPQDLKKGDIIAYKIDGGLGVHRFIRPLKSLSTEKLLTKGDNLPYFDQPAVLTEQLVGKVTAIEKDRISFDLQRPRWKMINHILVDLSSAQAYLAITLQFLRRTLLGNRDFRPGIYIRKALFFPFLLPLKLVLVWMTKISPLFGGKIRYLGNLSLLGFIIRGDYQAAKDYSKRKKVDFESFSDFAAEHYLTGSLYSMLGRSGLKNLFPVNLIEDFKQIYLWQWGRNEKLIREMERLAGVFAGFRKEAIFLKGPFLAQRFYGDIDRRLIADIDILIREEDIDEFERALFTDGFRRQSKVFFNRALAVYFTHHFTYTGKEITLELHWALDRHFSYKLDYRKIWDERQRIIFKDKPFYVLSDEYELVFQLLSIFRDIQLGKISLKSFLDTYMILKAIDKELNWEEFFSRRREEGLFLIALNILDLVMEIFDCSKEFPKLSACIKINAREIKNKGPERIAWVLDPSTNSLKNRLWGLRLYQAHPLKSFCWWGVSLPFRLWPYTGDKPRQKGEGFKRGR